MRTICKFLVLCTTTFGWYSLGLSHCEIPCGIYGDKLRIALLYEDISTIERSMKQIHELSGNVGDNTNQLVRWVKNKEEHANKIQHTVSQYFLHQRIKPVEPESDDDYKKYIKQLTTLHRILIEAMKGKQTTELKHVKSLRKLVGEFAGSYFSKEDLEHIREDHGGGA